MPGGSVRVVTVLAAAFVLADAATEGKKVIIGMLVTGLVLVALPALGETYMYFRYHRRGRSAH
jgi:RsiW-degrading membrane proteinase PrsW (M82 family)